MANPVTVAVATEISAGRSLLDAAVAARAARAGAIEDAPVDPVVIDRAIDYFRRARSGESAEAGGAAMARAWLEEADALLLRSDSIETVRAAEAAAREALSHLDSVANRSDATRAYLLLGRALAELAPTPAPDRTQRLEAAVGVLEAGDVLARQEGDALTLARLRASASRVLGERFRGGRDENLMDAVVAGEEALPALRAAHRPESSELPELLNHLGNCCAKIGVQFRTWLRRGEGHYREGASIVDAERYPRLHRVLLGNAAMVERLLEQDPRNDALPEKEMVSRFAAAAQAAIDVGDVESAKGHAFGFLRWGWSLAELPNVHIGEAHKLMGKIALASGDLAGAERHLYQAAVVLCAVLTPEHRWANLGEEAFALLGEALRSAGRGDEAGAAVAQARAAWPVVTQALDLASATGADPEADAMLERALRLYPDCPPLLLSRAARRIERGELVPALMDLNGVVSLMPQQQQARMQRAVLLSAGGDDERALADWNAVLEMESGNPAALLHRAQLQIRREQWDAARTDLDALLSTGDENPQAFYARALCREHLGDPAGAADDLERILPAFGDPADRQALQERIATLRAGVLRDA